MNRLLNTVLTLAGVSDDRKAALVDTILSLLVEIDEVDPSHGTAHALRVHDLAVSLAPRDLSQAGALILRLAAILHDVGDGKIVGAEERTAKLTALLSANLPGQAAAILAIIANIGVSKEAGRDYMGKKWSDERWREVFARFSNTDELVKIRHAVSAADMLTALGADGHRRAVEFNARKLGAGCKALDLVSAVCQIHVAKHVKLADWIHCPDALPEVKRGIDELVAAYNEWATGMGAPDTLLI